jgi:hypothetical protein
MRKTVRNYFLANAENQIFLRRSDVRSYENLDGIHGIHVCFVGVLALHTFIYVSYFIDKG